MKIHWPDKISNQQLSEQTSTILMSRTIQGMHWRWIGHVLQRDNSANIRTALTRAPDGKRGGKAKEHLQAHSREREKRTKVAKFERGAGYRQRRRKRCTLLRDLMRPPGGTDWISK